MRYLEAKDYLLETEPAVRHLFNGLLEYERHQVPELPGVTDQTGDIKLTKYDIEKFKLDFESYFALETARAILAGSILQVAFTFIKHFSIVSFTGGSLAKFKIKPKSNAAQFCTGRIIHGVPLGLIVYAGRNQYSHWDEKESRNNIVTDILLQLNLFYSENFELDMIYEVNYPLPKPVSHKILHLELGWYNYDRYIKDMNGLIGN